MPRFQQNINDPYLQLFLLYMYLKFVPSSCRCLLQVALAGADLMFYFVCLALFFSFCDHLLYVVFLVWLRQNEFIQL